MVAANQTSEIRHEAVPLGDVDATFADIRRARRELDWQPAITIEQGLESVVAWLNESAPPAPIITTSTPKF
jgi:UDP-glucuronate 4-epimerase